MRLILIIVAAVLSFGLQAQEKVITPSVSYGGSILQMMLGLMAILVMIFALVWLIKRTGMVGMPASNIIKMKSCLPLSAKEKIVLIEAGDEQFLVGVSPAGINHIATLKEPLNLTDKGTVITGGTFADKLKTIINKPSTVE